MKYFIWLTMGLLAASWIYGQKKHPLAKPFFIAQATYNKFSASAGTIGAAASLGIRFKQTVGAAIHSQLITFSGDNNPYIPLALEVSLLPEKIRPAPYFHFAIGQGIYSNKVAVGNFRSSITGGLYISAGAGIFLSAKKGGGMLLTGSYVNAGFKNASNVSGRLNADYALEGFRIGLGFKI